MADDDLTAELDRIAERHLIVDAADLNPSAFGGNPYAALVQLAATDSPRLLAALRAVLELADSWKREVVNLEPSGADAVQPAMPGNYLVSGRIGALEDCEDALREVITRALNGEKE